MAWSYQVRRLYGPVSRRSLAGRGLVVKDYHISLFHSEEDEGCIADIPDLGSCSAFGGTPEEALRRIAHAKAAWIGAAETEGKPVPEPT
jgi:predicted RNase H-like HicB family nuclease